MFFFSSNQGCIGPLCTGGRLAGAFSLSHTHTHTRTPFSGTAAKWFFCLYLPLVTWSFLSFTPTDSLFVCSPSIYCSMFRDMGWTTKLCVSEKVDTEEENEYDLSVSIRQNRKFLHLKFWLVDVEGKQRPRLAVFLCFQLHMYLPY